MKFLVETSLFCEPEDSREAQRTQILCGLQTEYCDSVSCKDAYLETNWCYEEDFIFGTDDPDAIVKAAGSWNTAIETRLWVAIAAYQRMPRETTLYDLKKAVMAADDDLYSFGDEAVLISDKTTGTYWLHPKLHDDQHEKVMQHPEAFAIVEVGTA